MATTNFNTNLGDWLTFRFDLMRIYEGRPAQPHRMGPDGIPSVQAWLLLSGSVYVQTDSGEATATAGQWLVTTSQKNRHDFSDDARILSLALRAQWPDDRTLFRYDPPVVLAAAAHAELETAARRLLAMNTRRDNTHYITEMPSDLSTYVEYRTRLQRLLRVYVRTMQALEVPTTTPREIDPRVLDAIRSIDHHSWREPFDERTLARRVGLSASQLHRLFTEQVGMTAFRYFDRRRFLYAQELLGSGDKRAKTVAYLLGFKQPSHFSSWFSKRQGVSPRQYRQSNRATRIKG